MGTAGIVFHIQRFSIHDGPGIRTSVFLKGCPMRCFWCHNPEGRRPRIELRYNPDRCIACGACVEACPQHAHSMVNDVHHFDREKCTVSGDCVDTCYSGALELNGKEMTAAQVVHEVLKDKAFYDTSHGGVTVSGGEPTLHSAFTRDILAECKGHGIHTAIETCGDCAREALESLLPVTDLVMMDLKHMDIGKHQDATGKQNDRILDNARYLARTGRPIIFRTPVVPTVNDSEEAIGQVAAYIRELIDLRQGNGHAWGENAGITYELLAFHRLAADKYASLGMTYDASAIDPPSKEHMATLVDVARRHGVETRFR
jgi:pyruvate formate lyase activating enzyme